MKLQSGRNKGVALMLSMIFSFVLAVTSYTLFFVIQQTMYRVKALEMNKMRCYYAELAGLRYANLLVQKRPDVLGFTPPPQTGDTPRTYTITGRELGSNFYAEMAVTTGSMTVTITEITSGTNQGEYTAKADYKY